MVVDNVWKVDWIDFKHKILEMVRLQVFLLKYILFNIITITIISIHQQHKIFFNIWM